MGMPVFGRVSKSIYDKPKTIKKYIYLKDDEPVIAQNPNPLVFIIEKIVQVGRFTIAQIHYPNCTNYEGKKILMWHGHSIKSISDLGAIDPHFSENMYTPIARFEPTIRGWKMAEKLAKIGF